MTIIIYNKEPLHKIVYGEKSITTYSLRDYLVSQAIQIVK